MFAPEMVVVLKATRYVTMKRRRELLGEALKSGGIKGYKMQRNGSDGVKLVGLEGGCSVVERLESAVYRRALMTLMEVGFMAVVKDTERQEEGWIRMEPQEGWREKAVAREEGDVAEAMEE